LLNEYVANFLCAKVLHGAGYLLPRSYQSDVVCLNGGMHITAL
jgi:hypothetical protein